MIKIKEIREKYPNPSRCIDRPFRLGSYCVGGAFCMANGKDVHFPCSLTLQEELEKVYDLPYREAMSFALDIMTYNDYGEFERAWALLQEIEAHYLMKMGMLA